MKPIAPNTLIQNRYLIVHLIGKGGMGEVYLAVDQRLGSAIALKRTFFSDDETLGHAFEREARTLARLRHPVLPKVSDHFTEEGTQYLVMEHISGEDISKRLETAEKLFPISWVLFWADQLLDALNYLHSHEPPIIHRDIKPQNLKLTDENHIVLLDFGLSKNSTGETRATTGGSIVGYTPHYAAMEQIRGTGTDARSDLYSLAATIYQIFTNTVPPDALTRADSLINGLPDPVTPINQLNPEVSKAVSDVILKAMAISQEQRYKTAREMQKALRDAYAQLQTDMTANTVALNTSALAELANLPQSPQKTAELTGVPLAQEMPVSQTKPGAYKSGAKTSTAPDLPSAPTQNEPNFDVTVQYNAEVPGPMAETASKQSDIRTEVFLAGASPAITAVQEEKSYARDNAGDSFSKADGNGKHDKSSAEEEDFGATGGFDKPVGYSPDATVPLFTFDKENGVGAAEPAAKFDSQPGGDRRTAAVADLKTTNGTATTDAGTYTSTADKSETKSGGKGLMVAGGIFALLFLVTGAVGIGWFMFRDSGTTQTDPTPTPTATVSTEPTAAPTMEIVIDTNVNSDTNSATNTDGNVDITNSNNTNAVVSPTRTTGTPRPAPTNTPNTGGQPNLPKPPTPKPIPAPTKQPAATKTPRFIPLQ